MDTKDFIRLKDLIKKPKTKIEPTYLGLINPVDIIKWEKNEQYILGFDKNLNEIHYKNSDGFSREKKYDKNGNEIHYKNSDGFSREKKYDKNGNEISYKNSGGDYMYYYEGRKIEYKEGKFYIDGEEYVLKSK